MGREAAGDIRFDGKAGPGKLLLEAEGLILRGAVRARIARGAIRGFAAQGDVLRIDTDQGPVEASLGAVEVAAWLRALARPLPTLAEKLGIGAGRAALRLGPVTDAALLAALAGAETGPPVLAIAEVTDLPRLEAALAAMAAQPGLPLWTVAPKGTDNLLPDAVLRARMRAAGWRDTKSCSVSPRMTASRWHPPTIAAKGA